MSTLAFLVKLIAKPRFTSTRPGNVRAEMPFLKVLGQRRGSVRIGSSTVSERWMAVIACMLPPFLGVDYDTANGTVDLRFECDPWDDGPILGAMDRLVDVAAEEAGRFIRLDGDSLEETRCALVRALDEHPVDMREPGSEDAVRRIVHELL